MPKRSNSFQTLIYLLYHQLHDRATVTESAMVSDRLGGSVQEVDVLILEPVGQMQLQIGVECRDRGRPATIEWVQQMRGKHQHRVDKLVLVSRSGFTKSSTEEARRHGIETLSLSEANQTDWNVMVDQIKELFAGKFNFRITKGYAVLSEEYGLIEDPEISANERLYDLNDELVGMVGEIALEELRAPEAGRKLMELFYAHQDKIKAIATFEVPGGSYLIDTSGTKRVARSIRLEITCEMSMTPVELQHGALGTSNVAWGQSSTTDGEELFLVITEHKDRPRQSSLSIKQRGQQSGILIDMIENNDCDVDS